MRTTLILAGTLLALAAGPASAQTASSGDANADKTGMKQAKAEFVDAKGKAIGSATLMETPNGVLIRADLTGLPAGEHGFHIHETGTCDAASGFKSAGGHYNPDGAKHGYMVEGGPHAGDMPNQTVASDGKLRAEVFNPKVSFSGKATLFDSDGSAIVIHAKPDDYRSQDSGDAGERIACAVIKR